MCLIKPKETEYVEETIIAPRRAKSTTYAYADGTYSRERVIIPASSGASTRSRRSHKSHRSHHSKTYIAAVPVVAPPPPRQMVENVYYPSNTVIVPVESSSRSRRGSHSGSVYGGSTYGGGSSYGGESTYGGSHGGHGHGGSTYATSTTRYIEEAPARSSRVSQVYTSERVAPAIVVERRGSRSYY